MSTLYYFTSVVYRDIIENMDIKDVKKLTELARIDVSEEEQKELLGDLKSILKYIDQIQSASVKEAEVVEPVLKNVFREDKDPHEPEVYTEKLLEAAPKKQEGYVKVKKIL